MSSTTYIHELEIGARGWIVGYDQARGGYQGKLRVMGLIPGIEFQLIRRSPFEDWVEIEVNGTVVKLHRYESDALCVEPIET